MHGHTQTEVKAVLKSLCTAQEPSHTYAPPFPRRRLRASFGRRCGCICATTPVAGADYSLKKSNGAAGERYAGGGRGEAGRGVGKTAPPHNCSYFSSAITSVAPAATSAELHCSAAADATGDGRAPAADVDACAASAVASGVRGTAAPAAAGGGTAIATVCDTAHTSTTPLPTPQPARANRAGPPPALREQMRDKTAISRFCHGPTGVWTSLGRIDGS